MTTKTELAELRRKDAKALLSDLEREKLQLARDRIAVRLGKFSKIHELATRKSRVARILTVLSEKLREAPVAPEKDTVGKKRAKR